MSKYSIATYPRTGLFRIARAGIFPRSSLLGAGQVGFWEFGMGGATGWREGQTGSVYKLPERRVDDSYHNWRVPSKWKGEYKGGTQRGARGQQQGADKSKWKCAMYMPCIYVIVLYVQRNDWMLIEWHIAVYIMIGVNVIANLMTLLIVCIIIGVNVVANLNSV